MIIGRPLARSEYTKKQRVGIAVIPQVLPVAGMPDFPTDLTPQNTNPQNRREIRQPLGCYQPLPNRNAHAVTLALMGLWPTGTTRSRGTDGGLFG